MEHEPNWDGWLSLVSGFEQVVARAYLSVFKQFSSLLVGVWTDELAYWLSTRNCEDCGIALRIVPETFVVAVACGQTGSRRATWSRRRPRWSSCAPISSDSTSTLSSSPWSTLLPFRTPTTASTATSAPTTTSPNRTPTWRRDYSLFFTENSWKRGIFPFFIGVSIIHYIQFFLIFYKLTLLIWANFMKWLIRIVTSRRNYQLLLNKSESLFTWFIFLSGHWESIYLAEHL